ncbi:MAG: hypothetical protein ABJA33_05070 [Pedococcus sp.]
MDPFWSLAATVELRRDLTPDGAPEGYVEARPHATGWFILGHCRAGVTEGQLADFREFTTVRTVLLLSRGPVPGVWRRVPGCWVADWVDPVEDLDSLSELEPDRFSGRDL